MTLVEFLLGRLGEDERHAHAALGILGHENEWWRWQRLHEVPAITRADARHIERWSPRRVLTEVEAKRRIVELHRRVYPGRDICDTCGMFGESDVDWPCETLRLLALPFADHRDYRKEWRP